ncbi:MAG: YggS family pyridoxal phosphate-dependent enzyme [Candidatus Omnitrophota bacterium]
MTLIWTVMMIKDNLFEVRRRIEAVCAKLGKNPDLITIVGVSKNRTVEQLKELAESGIADVGENKVQEALLKYNQLLTFKLHMVGHLQTNKVKEAVKIFDLIHSVDSLHLAAEIDKQACRINKIQDILIEVNTSQEAAKFGFKPDEVIGAVKQIAVLGNVDIKGLMTVAPVVGNPEQARPFFKLLRELSGQISTLHVTPYTLNILSMGMTDDFEIAIEEGSNMVRLGRVLFDG